MKFDFAMWKTALSTLVKMDSKQEWDELDFISKWLIATRSGVTIVTIYACMIAGSLAFRENHFAFLPWLVVTLGLFIAHGTNNLLNDYTDFSRGIDSENYFRTQYGVHPLLQGFWTKKQQLTWFAVSGVIATMCGVYAVFYTGFSPIILGYFLLGAIVLLFYTWPLKHLALGELSIFLIWGPIMVSAVTVVLSRGVADHIWQAALAGVPYGLSVVSINLGKHIDKSAEDRKKHVHTLPVLIGEKAARYLNMLVLLLIYVVIFYLVFGTGYFSPVVLIVLLAGKRWLYAFGALSKPRPEEPPKEWPGWPTWFSGFAFYHNRLFGDLFLIGILIDTFLRILLGNFWPIG
jgi:1,4-dihydroxy-2-naphthoate octaprenyltransferase